MTLYEPSDCLEQRVLCYQQQEEEEGEGEAEGPDPDEEGNIGVKGVSFT